MCFFVFCFCFADLLVEFVAHELEHLKQQRELIEELELSLAVGDDHLATRINRDELLFDMIEYEVGLAVDSLEEEQGKHALVVTFLQQQQQ